MTRTRLILGLLAVVSGILPFLCALKLACSNPIHLNEPAFATIKNEMTREDVEEIFGRPPGDYSLFRDVSIWNMEKPYYPTEFCSEWLADNVVIRIWFDKDGRVTGKHLDTKVISTDA